MTFADRNVNMFNMHLHARTSTPEIFDSVWPTLGSIKPFTSGFKMCPSLSAKMTFTDLCNPRERLALLLHWQLYL